MQGPCCIEDLWVRVRRCNFISSLQIKLECFTVRNCILIISYDFATSFIRLIHGFVLVFTIWIQWTHSELIAVRHSHLLMKIGLPISCMFSVIDLSPRIYKGQRSHTTSKIVTVEIQPKTFTCSPQAHIFQHVSGCINNPLQNLEPKVGAVICQR